MLRFGKKTLGILCVLLSLWVLVPIVANAQEKGQTTHEAPKKETEEKPSTTAFPPGEDERQKAVIEKTEEILIEAGGILIPNGTLVVEPSFNYTHISRNVIAISGFTAFQAILIGQIAVEDIDRDILTGALTLRYGLLDRLQLEVEIPYLYRHDRLVPTAETGEEQDEEKIDDHGLGDIEAALFAHLIRGIGWRPDVIFNFRWKSRTGRDPYELDTEEIEGRIIPKELATGTGHDGLSAGFTLVKAIDPVVFFGSASYFWNIERDVGSEFGDVDPGDSFEYSLGMATALSEKISLTLSFQNIITDDTTIEGDKLLGSETNAATTFLGASYRISKDVSVLTSVGIGLTTDSPDFQLQINVPISFSLF